MELTASGWTQAAALLCAAALLAAAGTARAEHSVGTEAGLGSMTMPGSGKADRYYTLSVFGTAELLEDRLSLDLGYGLFDPSDVSAAHLISAGVAYTPNEHWSLDAMLHGSPSRRDVSVRDYSRSKLAAVFPKMFPENADLRGSVNGRFTDESSQYGADLSAAYDTAGFGKLEWAFDALLGLSSLGRDETVTVRQQTLTSRTDESVLTLGLGATAILWENTDLSLRVHYYGYSYSKRAEVNSKIAELADAGNKGLFDFLQVNGIGMTLAPLRAEMQLGATHRFGRKLSATLQLGSGRYEEGGSTALVRLKLSGRPISRLRIYGSLALQRDRIPALGPDPIPSRYLGMGAEFSF